MRNIKKNVSKKIVRGTLKCKAAKKAEEHAKKKRKKSGESEEEQEADDDQNAEEEQLSSSGSSSTLYSDNVNDPDEDGKPQPGTSKVQHASMMTQLSLSPRGTPKI